MSGAREPGQRTAPGPGLYPAFARVPDLGPSDRGWFIGAGLSLVWTMPTLLSLWELPDFGAHVVGTAMVAVFAMVFLVSVPVIRRTSSRLVRLAPAAMLCGLSLSLVPWLGPDVRWMWTFVGVAVAVSRVGRAVIFPLVLALAAVSFAVGAWIDTDTFLSSLNSAVIVSVSFMMFSFVENITTLERLRSAQEQIADFAAERERSRVARDVHDILGHSLTVITVKAELAGRLMDAGSPAARDEVAQIEELARGALADVRTTVHGYRGVSISGELAAARAALESAGVSAELPGSTEQVPADRRELAGWVVREAVTNVVRHAGARSCRVRLGARCVEVADDGGGPSAAASTGSGLTGLRERVETAGARLSIGRSDLGGFNVKVTW
ncbi:sensor histidine kinase [Microbacterium trichothecenolyticum]|uniref:Two-component system sensor histidine kinase DesK n=1 Tax=Microbacterium trichothecenolyticum TaxID=69370 RepID=A0ABU0TWD6_MICTR|nr:sensor histidine kinase [Microbacterium trichothecenolyticum]MDQ1123969.1 two-component system sensor histidine kinase DesK [Microbacterium trichothecenolyticum]